MRRTGTPGKRFGSTILNSPGPSPATFNKPATPQHAIQPAHSQHGLPLPGPSPATFRKPPTSGAQIGAGVSHGQAMRRAGTPVNAGRPVSGVGRAARFTEGGPHPGDGGRVPVQALKPMSELPPMKARKPLRVKK